MVLLFFKALINAFHYRIICLWLMVFVFFSEISSVTGLFIEVQLFLFMAGFIGPIGADFKAIFEWNLSSHPV